ncbi:MAG TPA: hypothetical protein VIF08_07010, partial [Candidatus Limnocylindrales bacterium]
MFDIIGRRRWFYIFSLLITVPGLIFILLTPISGGKVGLQFSIDFTGGTVWEVHFKNGTPTGQAVQEVMAAQGLPGSVAITTSGDKEYVLIRTVQIGLRPQPSPSVAPSGSPATSGSPVASGSPGPSGSPRPSGSPGASATPTPAPSATTSATPSASPSAAASPSPSAAASPSASPAVSP